MGLFGGKKTYVTSVVYNLAGDINDRPNYLKSLIVRDNIYGTGDKAKSIKDGYLNGPGLKLRSFGRWSQGEYADVMGATSSYFTSGSSIVMSTLTEEISQSLGGADVFVQNAEIGKANYNWWAEKWIIENDVDQFGTDWTADITPGRDLTIEFVDGTSVTFDAGDQGFVSSGFYLKAIFSRTTIVHHPAVPGDPEADPPIPDQPAYNETVYGPLEYFLYRVGTGNPTLDAMLAPETTGSYYLPVIPIRLDNEFVGPDKDQWAPTDLPEDATDEEIEEAYKANKGTAHDEDLPINYPELYPMAKRAVKKSMGAKFGKITDTIAKNASLKDIDFAYVVFGVCLNTKEKAAKNYLWEFMVKLYGAQGYTDPIVRQQALAAYKASMAAWQAWVDGGSVGPEPERLPYPSMTQPNIMITNGSENVSGVSLGADYTTIIHWLGMAHMTGTGLQNPDAKVGDIWWEVGDDVEYTEVIWSPRSEYTSTKNMERVILYKQVSATKWEAYGFYGLEHLNLVYDNKWVVTTAKEAILNLDDDGNPKEAYEESAFIFPLHYQTLQEMSLVQSTQLSTACAYMVLNCYKIVKKKWYQSLGFQIFLIVVIIAISFVFPPLGATSGGILGSNAAVGMAIGLSGTAAIVLGGIVNAIAAMVVAKLIGIVSTAVFGAKLGAIIGAVAAFVAISVGSSIANGGSLSAAINQFSRADRLLALTQAAGSGFQGFVKASIAEMQAEMTDFTSDYSKQLQQVSDLYAENIGSDRAYIDPMGFTGGGDSYVPESVDLFLSRTLLLGSDVVELSHSFIYDFVDATLLLDLPK